MPQLKVADNQQKYTSNKNVQIIITVVVCQFSGVDICWWWVKYNHISKQYLTKKYHKSLIEILQLVHVYPLLHSKLIFHFSYGKGGGGGSGSACIVKGSYCSCHYCKCEKGQINCGKGHGHGGGYGKKYCYGGMEGEYCHCDYCNCKHGFGQAGYGNCGHHR